MRVHCLSLRNFQRTAHAGRDVIASCCAAIVGLAIVGGCSPSGPAVEYVEGRVLVDGEPTVGATVGFSPVGGAGLAAFGQTDASGVYRLTTTQGGRKLGGAPVGDYVVTVVKWRNRLEDLGPQPDPEDTVAAAKWQAEANRIGSLPPDYVVPQAYGDKATSPLKATVKKGRNTGPDFTFELAKDFLPGK